MSTAKALLEHKRSWSEENLQRVLLQDRVNELEEPNAQLVSSANSRIVATQKLELDQYEVCKKEKAALEERVTQLLIKLYDAERQNSKMQVDRRKRSSGSPMRKSGKIASAASSPLSSQTDASASASSSSQSLKTTKKEAKQSKKSVPSLKEMSEKNNSAAKAEKERKARDTEWQKTMGPALALLQEEEEKAKKAQNAATADEEKSDDKDKDDSARAEDGSSADQDSIVYSFDLRGLAKAVPGILLKTALEAEHQFAAADTNRNGLLDIHELTKALASMEGSIGTTITDGGETTLRKAVTDLGLDPDAEFDFLDTIHIMGKLAGEDTVVAPDKTMASPGDGEDSHHHHHKHHHHHQHHHRKTRRSIMGRRLSTSSSSDPSGRESDHSSTVCTVS